LCIAAVIQRLRSATRRDKVEPGALADFAARWLVRRNAMTLAGISRLSHTASKPQSAVAQPRVCARRNGRLKS
jgi:hypothetical protein